MFDEYDTTPVLIPEDELDAVDELEEEYQGKTVGKVSDAASLKHGKGCRIVCGVEVISGSLI
jgi:hypothetical protein